MLDEEDNVVVAETDEEGADEPEEEPRDAAWYTLSRNDPPQYSWSIVSLVHRCCGKTNRCIALTKHVTAIGGRETSTWRNR